MNSDEWPRWVKVHGSHIVKQHGNISTPAFADTHVDRVTGDVSVLVHDADEASKATAPAFIPGDEGDGA